MTLTLKRVLVTGGAGFLGSRGFASDLEGSYFRELRDDLNRHGVAVASIDYGFIPLHPLADMVDDARCAVRFLRAHAVELHIDPDRIGIWGSSYSGGHVLVVGALDRRVRCVVSQVPLVSSVRVQTFSSIASA